MTDLELRTAMAEAHGWRHQPHEPCGLMDIVEHWIDRQAKIHMELPSLEHWAWQCTVDLAAKEGIHMGKRRDGNGFWISDAWQPPMYFQMSDTNPARAVCEAWLKVCHLDKPPHATGQAKENVK